jgi:hypothetical protein
MAAAVGITEKFSLAHAGGDFPTEPFRRVPDGLGMFVLRIANLASNGLCCRRSVTQLQLAAIRL